MDDIKQIHADYYRMHEKFKDMQNTQQAWGDLSKAGIAFTAKYPGGFAVDLYKALVWEILNDVTRREP